MAAKKMSATATKRAKLASAIAAHKMNKAKAQKLVAQLDVKMAQASAKLAALPELPDGLGAHGKRRRRRRRRHGFLGLW